MRFLTLTLLFLVTSQVNASNEIKKQYCQSDLQPHAYRSAYEVDLTSALNLDKITLRLKENEDVTLQDALQFVYRLREVFEEFPHFLDLKPLSLVISGGKKTNFARSHKEVSVKISKRKLIRLFKRNYKFYLKSRKATIKKEKLEQEVKILKQQFAVQSGISITTSGTLYARENIRAIKKLTDLFEKHPELFKGPFSMIQLDYAFSHVDRTGLVRLDVHHPRWFRWHLQKQTQEYYDAEATIYALLRRDIETTRNSIYEKYKIRIHLTRWNPETLQTVRRIEKALDGIWDVPSLGIDTIRIDRWHILEQDFSLRLWTGQSRREIMNRILAHPERVAVKEAARRRKKEIEAEQNKQVRAADPLRVEFMARFGFVISSERPPEEMISNYKKMIQIFTEHPELDPTLHSRGYTELLLSDEFHNNHTAVWVDITVPSAEVVRFLQTLPDQKELSEREQAHSAKLKRLHEALRSGK